MSSSIVPIHRTNSTQSASSPSNKNDLWFDAFNFTADQDQNIRWLSRPIPELVQTNYTKHDMEKFRIAFDVENFKPDQIKIYILNGKLTISGVYEERSQGRYMQQQFEKTFDLPKNADVEAMASYITPGHMLVVEIPLNQNRSRVDHLQVTNAQGNDQRRLSFSLDKFNTLNAQDLLSAANLSNISPSGQQLKRTSITKTTTTTTTTKTGSSSLPGEITQLLHSVESATGSNQSQTTQKPDSHSSATVTRQIQVHNAPSSSTTVTETQTKSGSDLTKLPVEIPPELLASGGTITIQKRKVSMTKTTDGGAVPQPVSGSITTSNDSHLSSSATKTTNTNTSAQQLNTVSGHDSQTISNNERRMFTLEEFLQNKTWNPSIVNASDGKKILHMKLEMKPGTKADQLKISLNGHDLRVDVETKISMESGKFASEHSYRQVTLFSSCDVDQLKTELKGDGFLHIQVPIHL